MSSNLHKVLYLYKTPSKFYIQPVEEPNEALIIDRDGYNISSDKTFSVGLLPGNSTSCLIYGIIGIKELPSRSGFRDFDRYLIVITKATQIGLINNEAIYKMDQAQVIPFDQNMPKLENGQTDWNGIKEGMLDNVLQTPSFYFSYSHDLTNTLQRISAVNQLRATSPETKIHHYYDKRFLWNSHLLRSFDNFEETTARYRLPFIHGFVSVNKISIGHGINWILVSRRSIFRAGTRFNSRGIDSDGHVSNFVETEQIVEDNSSITRTSFVQVRGSIPLFWSQEADYRYKPAIKILPYDDHDSALKKHFEELTDQYGNVSVVNLIDKRGHEGHLEHEFSQRMSHLQKYYNIPYHYFDFHKECSKMRWYRLSILIDQLQNEIQSYGYFVSRKDQVIQLQTGIIRTNCIDSLDRTNVVQSMIAQHILRMQLEYLNALPAGSPLENHSDFMDTFKNTWADNADALSIQYAGTPALKTDFTRTGQRTHTGLVNDGINSLTRYLTNNFFDSYRQDSIDLFLGYVDSIPTPLYRPLEVPVKIPVFIVVLTFVVLYIYIRQ